MVYEFFEIYLLMQKQFMDFCFKNYGILEEEFNEFKRNLKMVQGRYWDLKFILDGG